MSGAAACGTGPGGICCSWHQWRYSSCNAPCFARTAPRFVCFRALVFGLSVDDSKNLIRSRSCCASDDADFARFRYVNSTASLRSFSRLGARDLLRQSALVLVELDDLREGVRAASVLRARGTWLYACANLFYSWFSASCDGELPHLTLKRATARSVHVLGEAAPEASNATRRSFLGGLSRDIA